MTALQKIIQAQVPKGQISITGKAGEEEEGDRASARGPRTESQGSSVALPEQLALAVPRRGHSSRGCRGPRELRALPPGR